MRGLIHMKTRLFTGLFHKMWWHAPNPYGFPWMTYPISLQPRVDLPLTKQKKPVKQTQLYAFPIQLPISLA